MNSILFKQMVRRYLIAIVLSTPFLTFATCKKKHREALPSPVKYAEAVTIQADNENPGIGDAVTFTAVYKDKVDRVLWSIDNLPATASGGILQYTFRDDKEHTFKVSCNAGEQVLSDTKKIKASVDNAAVNKDLIPSGGNLIFCSNWQEFTDAVGAAKPDDVIQLKNGTYTGSISFSKSGADGKPVSIIPETRGGVVINGNAEWNISGKYITIDGFYFARGTSTHPVSFSLSSSYCRFINSAIVEWNPGGADTRLVTVRGMHNEVGHCVLRKKNTPGMMLEVVRESSIRNDHLIHHVYFGYFKDPGAGNGFETVRISTSGQSLSSSYTTLENCVFERCDGESEIVSNKSGHNTYRNNTFLNSDGALTLRHGHDCLVEGNFFINTIGSATTRCNGIRVIGERHTVRNNYFQNLPSGSQAIQVEYGNETPHELTQYDQVKDALIEYNTVYGCDKGIRLGASRNPGQTPPKVMPPGGIFRNNLIVSTKGSNNSMEIEGEIISGQLFTYANNIIAGKDETVPASGSLPAGIAYRTTLSMQSGEGGLFWPADQGIEAGIQKGRSGPLYQADIMPYWIKVKMEAGDPDFSGVPW